MPKFQPGQSGNPGGRPRLVKDIQDLARQKTPQAIAALEAALEKPGERVAAAGVLLAYAYGRPIQRQDMRVIRSLADLSTEELLVLAGRDVGDGAPAAPVSVPISTRALASR